MDQRQTSDDIRERVGLPRGMVRNFMQQILNGVGYCHTHRVLHRDLKPHNVSVIVRYSVQFYDVVLLNKGISMNIYAATTLNSC